VLDSRGPRWHTSSGLALDGRRRQGYNVADLLRHGRTSSGAAFRRGKPDGRRAPSDTGPQPKQNGKQQNGHGPQHLHGTGSRPPQRHTNPLHDGVPS
jgi:hypothetical protein